jgi:hypothetical protein
VIVSVDRRDQRVWYRHARDNERGSWLSKRIGGLHSHGTHKLWTRRERTRRQHGLSGSDSQDTHPLRPAREGWKSTRIAGIGRSGYVPSADNKAAEQHRSIESERELEVRMGQRIGDSSYAPSMGDERELVVSIDQEGPGCRGTHRLWATPGSGRSACVGKIGRSRHVQSMGNEREQTVSLGRQDRTV